MIFVREKSRAKYLYGELASDKLHVGVSHSDLTPKEVRKKKNNNNNNKIK
jgi:superfamily II DNA/RNA helicase